MRKLMLIFFIAFNLFLFLQIRLVYAQSTPGLECGVAGDTNGANKCCNPSTLDCSLGLLGNLSVVPGIGGWIDEAKKKCTSIQDFQNKYPGLKCLYGNDTTDSRGNCTCELSDPAKAPIPEIQEMCKKYLNMSNPTEFNGCMDCASHGFWTGIGCIPLSIEGFVGFVFTFGIGLGGIIALLCIIYSAFVMQTAAGNPERIKKAQENLTSCILGLMLIIFSIFILRLIGVSILKIPGLN